VVLRDHKKFSSAISHLHVLELDFLVRGMRRHEIKHANGRD
jgi:hypothetical protein